MDTKTTEQIFFDTNSCPYGLTYGEWTVKWWEWFLSTPATMNPIIDESGEFADVGQPDKDVWFLAGSLASEDKNFPKRTCNVPFGRSILFPIINCEANR